MRHLLFALVISALASCQSLERLGRVSPLAGEVAEERVNLWPLFYKNGEEVAVLWPIYDQDEQGFALRPLVTKDDSDWEFLPPIAWWDTESENWVFVPAYSFGESWGVFPVMGFGDFSFVGPAWWKADDEGQVGSYGLFPLATSSPELSWATLAWWKKNPEGDVESYGLFPLVTSSPELSWATLAWWDKNPGGNVESYGVFPLFSRGERFEQYGPVVWAYNEEGETEFFSAFPLFGYGALDDGREASWAGPVWWVDGEDGQVEDYGLFPLATNLGRFHQAGPVFWGDNEEGDTDYVVAFPLFGYKRHEDGGGTMLSLLGGKGWDEKGELEWVNLLGPVYHHSQSEDSESTYILWPLLNWNQSAQEESWSLWPVLGHTNVLPIEQTETQEAQEARTETWGLAGLYESSSGKEIEHLRLAPLFSYVDTEASDRDFFDWIALVGYEGRVDGQSSLHLGTPLVFNYHNDGAGKRWNALLGIFDYESDGTDSSFDLLYYLYRQQTIGEETRRDLFPFVTWDSGPERTKFSFLWRLFNYESHGNQSGGHILFIPWGDTGKT